MRTMRLACAALLVLSFAPVAASAAERVPLVLAPDAAPDRMLTSTEYFAFGLGIGSYLGAMGFDIVTLRWPSLFVTLCHLKASGFLDTGFVELGAVAGYPLHFGRGRLYSFRFGVALGLSVYTRGKAGFTGFGVGPEVSFVVRRSEHFAWQLTVAVHVPLAGRLERVASDPTWTPTPAPTLTFGARY